MNLLFIPMEVCNVIEKKLNAFWWGITATGRGIRWLSWDKMYVGKEEWGLGFRKLRNFNTAMLAKTGLEAY